MVVEVKEAGDQRTTWREPIQQRRVRYGTSLDAGQLRLGCYIQEGGFSSLLGGGLELLCSSSTEVAYSRNW